MPRGGHRSSRKRPAFSKHSSKPKWLQPSASSLNDQTPEVEEEEEEELSQYDQLLLTFKHKIPKIEGEGADDDDGGEDGDDGGEGGDDGGEGGGDDDEGGGDDDGARKDAKEEEGASKASSKEDEEDDDDENEDDDKEDGDKEEGDDENEDDDKEDGDGEDDHIAADSLTQHFGGRLEDTVAEDFLNKPTWISHTIDHQWLSGMTYHQSPVSKPPHHLTTLLNNHTTPSLKTVPHVHRNISTCNKKFLPSQAAESADPLTPFQDALFNILDSYLDIHLCGGAGGDEEVKVVYCAHVLRHILKSTKVILNNNEKLKNKSIEEARDQGVTSAKVLIVVPTRAHAFKIISIIISLLYADKLHVTKEGRLVEEYGCEDDDVIKKGLKPEDFEATFSGNTNDNFKLGVVVRKRSLKLFSDFYKADVIIASPLALKHVIRPNNTTTGHWDFLSSIEVMVIDCMHVLLMQNWSDVMLLLGHTNKRLTKNRGVDLSRVRMSCLNAWSSLYRQSILISPFQCSEFKHLFNKHCNNLQGKLLIQPPILHGSICNVICTLPQTFRRFDVTKVSDVSNNRFSFFTKNILPEYLSDPLNNVLIFIPSYFDFVRVRNHFKKEEISHAVIADYTDAKEVQKARQQFFKSDVKFLLFTERFHFYHRYQIKGISHLIFYDLPHNGHFYSEMCNMLGTLPHKPHTTSHHSCLVLYSSFDLHKLTSVLGTRRGEALVVSDKTSHLFMPSSA